MRKNRRYFTGRCGLDLGGIAKGWTVDRVSEGLKQLSGFARSMPVVICVVGGKEMTGRFGSGRRS